jgi:hypothetical protein
MEFPEAMQMVSGYQYQNMNMGKMSNTNFMYKVNISKSVN